MTIVTRDIELTAPADLGSVAYSRVSIILPRPADLAPRPIVAFALPGAGYNRGYFTLDLFSEQPLGQAGWHAQRGWIFVAIDTIGVGEASMHEPSRVSPRLLAETNHAVVSRVLGMLADGGLREDFPKVADPVVLGLGQSMGGGLTIVQQAFHQTYDAVAILGFSAVYTQARSFPGCAPAPLPYLTRDAEPSGSDPLSHEARYAVAVNRDVLRVRTSASYPNDAPYHPSWHYHFDDVDAALIERDFSTDSPPPWRSLATPGPVFWLVGPGAVAPEAAAITVPVLSAFGERDVAEDPRAEHKAFRNAVDFSSFICPRMGHMHNFATTRELLWARIHHWGAHVADLKARLPDGWPAGLYSDGR